jgi:hypothetical protein
MDLRNPEDLATIIDGMFIAVCREVGIKPLPSREAMEPLIAPGRQWAPDDLKDVDLNQLHDHLQAIATAMLDNSFGSVARLRVDQASVARALLQSDCHYLWFC